MALFPEKSSIPGLLNHRLSAQTLFVALFIGFLPLSNLYAINPYDEFGGGLSKASGESGGYGFFTLALPLWQAPLSAHLFTQARYTSLNDPLLAIYPGLRIEWWRFTVGYGYSPKVWSDPKFIPYQSSKAQLIEAQFLLPITPEIDFGLTYATQSIKYTSTIDKSLRTQDMGIFFRLHFGFDSTDTAKRRTYKGWRYPFGIMK